MKHIHPTLSTRDVTNPSDSCPAPISTKLKRRSRRTPSQAPRHRKSNTKTHFRSIKGMWIRRGRRNLKPRGKLQIEKSSRRHLTAMESPLRMNINEATAWDSGFGGILN